MRYLCICVRFTLKNRIVRACVRLGDGTGVPNQNAGIYIYATYIRTFFFLYIYPYVSWNENEGRRRVFRNASCTAMRRRGRARRKNAFLSRVSKFLTFYIPRRPYNNNCAVKGNAMPLAYID